MYSVGTLLCCFFFFSVSSLEFQGYFLHIVWKELLHSVNKEFSLNVLKTHFKIALFCVHLKSQDCGGGELLRH